MLASGCSSPAQGTPEATISPSLAATGSPTGATIAPTGSSNPAANGMAPAASNLTSVTFHGKGNATTVPVKLKASFGDTKAWVNIRDARQSPFVVRLQAVDTAHQFNDYIIATNVLSFSENVIKNTYEYQSTFLVPADGEYYFIVTADKDAAWDVIVHWTV